MKNILLILITLFVFVGCASKEAKITLLPDSDGKVGVISVADKNGVEHTINKAYDTLEVSNKGDVKQKIEDAKVVTLQYGDVLTSLPQKPTNYYFFFDSGSATLKEEQITQIKDISNNIIKNGVIEVICIGHSDSSGTPQLNEKLSQERAKNVADIIEKSGVEKTIIRIEYYADANPLVVTKNNEPHPQNRRVEILLK